MFIQRTRRKTKNLLTDHTSLFSESSASLFSENTTSLNCRFHYIVIFRLQTEYMILVIPENLLLKVLIRYNTLNTILRELKYKRLPKAYRASEKNSKDNSVELNVAKKK